MILLFLLAADTSGVAPGPSPLVGYSISTGGERKGPTEAGVLDLRTGAAVWSERLDPLAWPRACGNLLLVTSWLDEERRQTRAYSLVSGSPRFKVDGAMYDIVGRGRPLFRDGDRFFALDASTGSELWRLPTAESGWLRFLPALDILLAHSNKTHAAYSARDGRMLWERARDGSDDLNFAGGRLWLTKRDQTHPVEIEPLSGREREATELPGPVLAVVDQGAFASFILERSVVRVSGSSLSRAWMTDLPVAVSSGWGDARSIVLDARGKSDALLLLDAATGRLLANEPLEEIQSGSSSMRMTHPRYVLKTIQKTGHSPVVRILDRTDGRLAWKDTTEDHEEGWKEGFFLVRRGDTLHALDVARGAMAWTAPIAGIWKDTERRCGRILIATSRAIVALDAQTGRECWRRDFGAEAGDVTLAPAAR
jgi:outer membrane protein assembly factor BamB